jgi:hypothetical protein
MLPKTITLTHANLGEKIEVATQQIAAWYHSPGAKCTFVLATGGALLPVSESTTEVSRLYNFALAPEAKQPVAMTPVTPITGKE